MDDVVRRPDKEYLAKKYKDLPLDVLEDHISMVETTDTISFHYRVLNRHMGERFRSIVADVLREDYARYYKRTGKSDGFRYLYTCNDELSPIDYNVTYMYDMDSLQTVLDKVFQGQEFTHVSSRDTSTSTSATVAIREPNRTTRTYPSTTSRTSIICGVARSKPRRASPGSRADRTGTAKSLAFTGRIIQRRRTR